MKTCDHGIEAEADAEFFCGAHRSKKQGAAGAVDRVS